MRSTLLLLLAISPALFIGDSPCADRLRKAHPFHVAYVVNGDMNRGYNRVTEDELNEFLLKMYDPLVCRSLDAAEAQWPDGDPGPTLSPRYDYAKEKWYVYCGHQRYYADRMTGLNCP